MAAAFFGHDGMRREVLLQVLDDELFAGAIGFGDEIKIAFELEADAAEVVQEQGSGFTRDREIKERKAVGTSGGWFGRSNVVIHKRVELVILVTAKIVAGVAAP